MKTITARLEQHAKWLRGEEGGERLVEHGDAFLGADLCGADLRWADLSDATLREADLREADLRWADLCGAVGFHLLPVQDPRGYSFVHAVECGGVWRIRAGCRRYTISEAREHWGPSYAGDREIGDMYLHAVEWLARKVGEPS